MFQRKLIKNYCYMIFVIWIIHSIYPIFAQDSYKRHLLTGLPEFKFDIVNINSNLPERSCLNFYIEIVYDDLQFVKNDSGFMAAYEVSISISSNDAEQIEG
ncbi:hypothetical protein JW964_25805, partial [candidate division KSB1 bacterium]|nr:hypothetical protein [candidate division KSB1 bacterium]